MSLKLEWNDALNTGHRTTDIQHKYLVDIINDLAEAIETGKAAQSIRKILNTLQYYTEWHFCREEKCMEEYKCPVAAANKKAHSYFIQTFIDFREEFNASGGSEDIAMRMYTTLTDWLVSHIQKVDTNLGKWTANCANGSES